MRTSTGFARNRAVAVLAGLLVVAAPQLVVAQAPDPASLTEEEREELGRLFTRARTAYEAGNYLESIAFLEQAHEIFPDPAILYRIGDAYESAGSLADAVRYYERYLGAAPSANDRGIVSRRIADLQRRLEAEAAKAAPQMAVLVLDSNPVGATVEIDGAPTDHTTPARIELEPGKHQLRLTADDHEPVERAFELEPGDSISLVYTLEPLPIEEPEPRSPVPWVVTMAGAASLVSSGALFLVHRAAAARVTAWDEERDAAHSAGEPVPTRPPEYDETLRRSVLSRNAAFVAGGVGAVALTGGVIWLAARPSENVSLRLGPLSVGIAASF